MLNEDVKKSLIHNYIQSYNNFDVEGMVRDLHQDIIFKNISNGETNLELSGITAFKDQAEQAKSLFSHRNLQIKDLDFENEAVVADISYQGTIAVDLPNGMKKGDKLSLTGKSIFKFKNNKIIEIKDIS